MRRSVTRVLVLTTLLILMTFPARQASAYRSFADPYHSQPGIATSIYLFYDYIDSTLHIQNSFLYSIRSINQWTSTSWFTVFDAPSGGSLTKYDHVIYPSR